MTLSIKEPVVSIIVPIYNVEPYLHKCVDSIINQTYKNLEIILVDDGSPDDCPQICDEYREKDSRVVVIHKENGGLSDARNAGLDVVTGKYVTFIDSDDWYAEDAIEILVGLICKYNTPIACMRNVSVSSDYNSIEEVKNDREEHTISSHELVRRICEKKYSTSVCNKLFIHELWNGQRFCKDRLNEDFFILCELLMNNFAVATIDYPGYFYYTRPDSLTHHFNSSSKSVRDAILNSLELKDKAKKRARDLVSSFSRIALYQARTLLIICPNGNSDIESFMAIKKCLNECKSDILQSSLKITDKIILLCAMINIPITARIARTIYDVRGRII